MRREYSERWKLVVDLASFAVGLWFAIAFASGLISQVPPEVVAKLSRFAVSFLPTKPGAEVLLVSAITGIARILIAVSNQVLDLLFTAGAALLLFHAAIKLAPEDSTHLTLVILRNILRVLCVIAALSLGLLSLRLFVQFLIQANLG